MFKEKLAPRMKGWATFRSTDEKTGNFIEWKISNAIQPPAKDITARNLIQDPAAIIDTISLYYQGNLVYARSIIAKGIVSNAQVFFQTTFLTTDFNGNFDAARLTASAVADYSIIANLVGSKNSTESLLVTWNIQIE
jgi:hypothetical protein